MPDLAKRNAIVSVGNNRTRFNQVADGVLLSLSDTTKRQYRHTFNEWLTFCETALINCLELNMTNVGQYLESLDISSSTKKARLSHLRKFTEVLMTYIKTTGNLELAQITEGYFQQLKLLKIKGSKSDKKQNKTALSRKQVYDSFQVFADDTKLHKRNRAILAVLFYTGARRAECASLKWSNINFEQGYVYFPETKGSKDRTVYFIGDIENYLLDLKDVSENRECVFTSIRRGDHFSVDKPMSEQAIYNLMKQVSEVIGVDISPHDARRTLISDMLDSGSNTRDVQQFIGHAKAETTLRYAQAKDAKETAKTC